MTPPPGASTPRRPRSRIPPRVSRRWLVPTLWAAVTLTLTSIPDAGHFAPPLFAGADKIVHGSLYALLALLIVRAVEAERFAELGALRVGLIVLAAVSLLGWVDEWHQQYIPGRSRETADWAADSAGAAFGTFFAATARRRRDSAP
jgi:VanZ family protein